MSKKQKVLITGAAGFIGFHLAKVLSEDSNNELILVDNLSRGRQDSEFNALLDKPNVSFTELDLTLNDDLKNLPSDVDLVYHLAAIIGVKKVTEVPEQVVSVNAISTINMINWFCASSAKKILFSSTSEVYAWTANFHSLKVPTPENVPLSLTDLSNPRSSYAGSKIFGELAFQHMCKGEDKSFVIVRFHNVYGPRMGYDHVIPQMFERMFAQNEDPFKVYSADHTRAFCYVSDAIDCMLASMKADNVRNETFNVGNDKEEISISSLAKEIQKYVGQDLDFISVEAANDPIKRRCPNIDKARDLLNFEPKVSLEEGVTRTLDWYKNNCNPLSFGRSRKN